MKQIRHGVFETNSSSTHSITMCLKSEYDQWKNGEAFFDRWGHKFVTKDVVDQQMEECRKDFLQEHPDYIQGDEDWEEEFKDWMRYDKQYYSYREYCDDLDYESYSSTYETPNGETVVAFGYYGYDY